MPLQNTQSGLNRYLIDLKAKLKDDLEFHFVLGSESSDLDSMASSLMYAYYISKARYEAGHLFLPVLNVPRRDFRLRPEAVYLFNDVGVKQENLLFIDEINLEKLHSKGSLSLILIDHNRLAESQDKLAQAVEEIIDHHEDEGLYPWSKRTIELVGSTATLVAEKIFQTEDNLLDAQTGRLLSGAILLDTVNLDPEAKRVTPRDELIARRLLKLTGTDQNELFELLQYKKFDVCTLRTVDLLRKDYKEWKIGKVKYGISSVLMPLKQWIEKDPDIVREFSNYAKSKELDLLLAMNAYNDPDFHRELVVFSPDRDLREKLHAFFKELDLGLDDLDPGKLKDAHTIAFFKQGNLAKSRKRLQPVLNNFFTSM